MLNPEKTGSKEGKMLTRTKHISDLGQEIDYFQNNCHNPEKSGQTTLVWANQCRWEGHRKSWVDLCTEQILPSQKVSERGTKDQNLSTNIPQDSHTLKC